MIEAKLIDDDIEFFENIINSLKNTNIDKLLLKCCEYDLLVQVKLLTLLGANINTQEPFGFTPIMLSLLYSRYDIFLFLLENNSNIWIQNMNGDNCLTYSYALIRGRNEFIDIKYKFMKRLLNVPLVKNKIIKTKRTNINFKSMIHKMKE